jgi:chromosome segregation ATPase
MALAQETVLDLRDQRTELAHAFSAVDDERRAAAEKLNEVTGRWAALRDQIDAIDTLLSSEAQPTTNSFKTFGEA